MKRQTLLIAAGLMVITGMTKANAFDNAKYQAVKAGKQACPWCDLSGADFTGVKITGVDLSGANLTDANLSKAAFTKVDLSGADLTSAVLDGTDFSNTNLKGADLDQVDLSGAILVGANIETAYCDWATKLPANTDMVCEGVAIQRKEGVATKRKMF